MQTRRCFPARPLLHLLLAHSLPRRSYHSHRPENLESSHIGEGDNYEPDDDDSVFVEVSEGDAEAPTAAEGVWRRAGAAGAVTAADRSEAAERRRALHAAARALSERAAAELRAEVARDASDGAAAIPPLAPPGWAVRHPAGSSFFTMTRCIPGARDSPGAPGGHGSGGGAQSVYAQLVAPSRRRASDRGERRGRHDTDSNWAAAGQPPPGTSVAAPRRARADTHVVLYCPFRSLDPSLLDPRLPLCEWAAFDLLAIKRPPADSGGSSEASSAAVWDERHALYVRLASVGGTSTAAETPLRVRSVQLLSAPLAEALATHACMRRAPDPHFTRLGRSYARRKQRAAAVPTGFDEALRASGAGGSGGGGGTYEHPLTQHQRIVASAPLLSRGLPHAPRTPGARSGAESLLADWGAAHGEAARRLVYGGPCVSELSRELRGGLLDYLSDALGVTADVAEYVSQMQYFMEQEEYTAWLARWKALADATTRML